MVDAEKMVRRLYDGFNRRDIPAVLALLSEDVAWANGMDGGHVIGHEAVQSYWTQQWTAIQPQVDPISIILRGEGSVAVEVRQIVLDLKGQVLLNEVVHHLFRIEDGLVARFDIEQAGGLRSISHG